MTLSPGDRLHLGRRRADSLVRPRMFAMACLDVNVPKKPRARFSQVQLESPAAVRGHRWFRSGLGGNGGRCGSQARESDSCGLGHGSRHDYQHDGAGEPLWPDWLIEWIGPECFAQAKTVSFADRGVAAISEGGLRARARARHPARVAYDCSRAIGSNGASPERTLQRFRNGASVGSAATRVARSYGTKR